MSLASRSKKVFGKMAKDAAEKNASYWYTVYRLEGMNKVDAFKASRVKAQNSKQ